MNMIRWLLRNADSWDVFLLLFNLLLLSPFLFVAYLYLMVQID